MTVQTPGLAGADYAVVTSFFAVMIAVGVFFGRKQKNMSQFFGGGKQVPWWLSGISFYMCSFSALAFVMYSALAYKYGWLPVTISWLSVPAVLLGAAVRGAVAAGGRDESVGVH
jgi:Na+/proline symporter